MNAAIRSIIRSACSRGIEPWGVFRGYEGLLAGDLIRLGWRNAGGIVHHGGTVLKTARCPAFREKEAQARAADLLRSRGMDGLIVIGGDGSMAGAAALQELGIATAVVPATIDNDMYGTEETIGYDTAVNTVLESVSRIRDTAASHDRAAVVEVMGRHAGHIALAAGLAGGAEFTLVPEVPFSREAIADSSWPCRRKGAQTASSSVRKAPRTGRSWPPGCGKKRASTYAPPSSATSSGAGRPLPETPSSGPFSARPPWTDWQRAGAASLQDA